MKKLALVFALSVPLLAAAQDKSKRKLEWKLPAGQVVEYTLTDARTNKAVDRDLFFFPHELGKDGRCRIVIDRYADIPLHFLFTLPKEEVKLGGSWEHSAFFFLDSMEHVIDFNQFSPVRGGAINIKPVAAKGSYAFKKIEKDKKDEDELALIDGQFELFEIRRDKVNNQTKFTITKNRVGTLQVSLAISIARGLLVRGAFAIEVPRAEERVYDAKNGWEIKELKLNLSHRLELKEVVKLEREKLAKAVEAQAKKAVDWLKKQQKTSGDFGSGRTMENDRIDTNYTGLVARALLAAGVKSEDESIQKALRFLKGANIGTPQASALAASAIVSRYLPGLPWTDLKLDEVRAAFRKNFPKEDFATVKSLADGILAKRHKLGTWGASEKQRLDTQNPVSTLHAAECLFYASLAGCDIAGGVWKDFVDRLSTSGIDEADAIELDLGFADGQAGIEPEGQKKVVPATWRFNLDHKPSNNPLQPEDPGGFCFTTLGVLEILALSREETKLLDSQLKNSETAMRRGLAWIQAHWSLRSPPPPEAAWSVQRIEYLSTLMRVLTMYGVKTVAGSDWWIEGSYLLLRGQFTDGSWDSSGGLPVMDTAYALLFLTQGALRAPAHK